MESDCSYSLAVYPRTVNCCVSAVYSQSLRPAIGRAVNMFSCKCLNVILETDSEGRDSSSSASVTSESLGLSREEVADHFFQQTLLQIEKLTRINKTHSSLVDMRTVGSWIVYKCLNCGVHTHAFHKDKGAGLVVINSKLLTSKVISAKRTSQQFSKVFNIVIAGVPDDLPSQPQDYMPTDIEITLDTLKAQVNDYLKKEDAATEERIRHYTEQQYLELEEFREQINKDLNILSRIIKSKISIPTSTNKDISARNGDPTVTAATVPEQNNSNSKPATDLSTRVISTVNSVQSPRRPSHKSLSQRSSIDSEGLFQLDGVDSTDPYSQSEDEPSDEELNEETRSVGQKHKSTSQQKPSMAKSLPMNIPVFLKPLQGHENEDQDDALVSSNPKDIAASMKALAKSIQSDAVFGELPRPRCKTHI